MNTDRGKAILHSRGIAVSVLLLLAMSASHARSQVLRPPPRVAPTEPATTDQSGATRPRQTLTLFSDVLVGEDANSPSGLEVGESPADPLLSNSLFATFLQGGLTYDRQHRGRSISLTGEGGATFYQDADRPNGRGSFDLTAATPLGRSNTLRASQRLTYESAYSLRAFGPIADLATPGEAPTPESAGALFDEPSWTSETSADLSRTWSRRDSTTIGYSLSKRIFLDGEFGNNTAQTGAFGYTRLLGRTSSLVANYHYSTGEFQGAATPGEFRPLSTQGVDVGPRFVKRISPRRTIQVSGSAGATYVKAESGEVPRQYDYWAPYGQGMVAIDLARTWALRGSYRRGVTVLDGLTSDAYLADALIVSVGGQLNSRLELVLGTGYATGRVGPGAETSSDYYNYTGVAQIGVTITRHLSGILQYTYYRYHFSDSTALPTGLPTEFGRGAVRAGLSVRLPLLESGPRRAR